jgi:hypothetical protein
MRAFPRGEEENATQASFVETSNRDTFRDSRSFETSGRDHLLVHQNTQLVDPWFG